MQTPLTYLWSPSVLPKPKDWGPSIQIAGYCFYDPPASYQASQELLRFLEAGEAPIYIGFGSNFILDQGREPLTRLLYDAVTKSGLRAVIAQNWVVSSDSVARPDNVCVVEHTPHAWLFPRMAAIVHHGGAGTVAMTLRCGKPSVCVPFIFDQFSWAVRLSDLGLGSRPLPHTQLTANKLAEAIRAACEGEMETRAKEMAKKIAEERDGAEVAVDRFYKILQTQGFPEQCAFLPGHNAVWQVQGRDVKISGLAAAVLVQEKRLAWEELTLDRRFDWSTFPGFKGQKVSDFKETTTTPVKGQRIAQSIFDFDAVEDGGAAKAEVIDRVVRGWEKPKST
ncbi:MAG: hypothetical protein M1833_005701 [Piccolia ochrophora]|nr:MAG: hypothetical protein M1833_005701 [Piccolia ochrophora]